MADVLSRTDLLGKNLLFLLDLEYAGRVFRLSSKSHVVLKEDGTDVPYESGLSVINFVDEVDLFSLSPKLISVPIDLVLAGVDIAELVSQGYDLTTLVGTLSLWVEGTTYESRRLLLKGLASEPIYGALNEPISFSLEQNPYNDLSSIIDPKANVNEVTWPDINDESATEEDINVSDIYPTIFGAPTDQNLFAKQYTTPALVVDVNLVESPNDITLLVAGHHVQTLSGDNKITIAALDSNGATLGTGTKTPTLIKTFDNEGRSVTTCVISYDFSTLDDGKFYAKWNLESFGISETPGESMRGAGDIIEYMLKRSAIDVDLSKIGGAKSFLNTYLLDFYVNDTVSYWDFIKSNILPILPVSVDVGAEGLYLVPWNFEPSDDDFVADLDMQNIRGERTSSIEYENPKELLNDITLEYNITLPTNKYSRLANAHGDVQKTGAITGGSFLNTPCRASHQRFGAKKKTIQSDVIYDEVTAASVVTWMSYAFSARTRSITYELDYSWAWLKAGDLVRLTDTDVHLNNLKAFVESITYSDFATINITFKIFDSMQD